MEQDTTQQKQHNKINLFKNKKLLIIIGVVVLIVIALILVLVTIFSNNQSLQENQNTTPVDESSTLPSALLYFNDPAILTPVNTPVTTNININTEGEFITGAVISVEFDPALVSNISIEQFRDPNSALSNAFEDAVGEVDLTQGVAWITLSMSEQTPPQAGSGAVAQITFTPSAPTILSFGANSALVSRLSQNPILVSAPSLEVMTSNIAPDAQERLNQQDQLLLQPTQ